MIEIITAWAIQYGLVTAGGTILAAFLTWILHKIPTESVRKAVYEFSFMIGAAITRFFSNWKWTKSVWNATLEPWLIGFLDMVLGSIIQGIFDGLKSDNDK